MVLAKPAAMMAAALVTPGTLGTVILFTIVAAAELLLNDKLFVCPCRSDLSVAYGLSFLLIPAVILFLADFPWKLLRSWPSSGVLCTLARRPFGLAVIWIMIGTLERKMVSPAQWKAIRAPPYRSGHRRMIPDQCLKAYTQSLGPEERTNMYVDCMLGQRSEDCEPYVPSTVVQLLSLYLWVVIIGFAFALVICRRRKASCITGRSEALELQIKHSIEEKQERMCLEKKVKYGKTELVTEDDLSLKSLQTLQPGLNSKTYGVLKKEDLLKPSVLRFLRTDDVYSLDVSIAQRCLLRNLVDTVEAHPEMLSDLSSQPRRAVSHPTSTLEIDDVYVNAAYK